MKGSRIKNSRWYEGDDEYPRYFKTNGKLHFDQTKIDEHQVASLSFSAADYERLVYTETIETEGKGQLTLGLIIRGNDIDEINYKIAFYDASDLCLDVCCLVYTETIETEGKGQLTLGLIIRGNDIDEINYKIAFYDASDLCLDVCCHNVASEISPNFKRVCVTYPIPNKSCYVRVGWEFKGIVTGVTLFHPSLVLMD